MTTGWLITSPLMRVWIRAGHLPEKPGKVGIFESDWESVETYVVACGV